MNFKKNDFRNVFGVVVLVVSNSVDVDLEGWICLVGVTFEG